MKRKTPSTELLLTLPSFGWLALFFAIPTFFIFIITFKPHDLYGGIGAGWTITTIRSLSDPNYPAIIWRTLWLSVATTFFCLALGIPAAYYIARKPKKIRDLLLLAIVVPFWTSFLVRIFAWKQLLHPEGAVRNFLLSLGLIAPQELLLYRPESVLLVLVYSYLPFAILPLYAAAEKFDFTLLEAARDLGASNQSAFLKIFLPGIRQGIITAVLVVLIPALGSYVIPDIVGGPGGEMIGNKIAQRSFVDRNLPHAAALSAALVICTLLPFILAKMFVTIHRLMKQQGPR